MWRSVLTLCLSLSSFSVQMQIRNRSQTIVSSPNGMKSFKVRNVATTIAKSPIKVAEIPLAKFANCKSLTTPVEIPNDDMTVFYRPKCVLTKRCAGCCYSEALQCQPVKTSIKYFKVLKASYSLPSKFKFEGYKIIPLEKHETCTCDCRTQPHHCSAKQLYIQKECRCICSNKTEMDRCTDSNEFWDDVECVCRNIALLN